MRIRRYAAGLLTAAVLTAGAASAQAQTADNVLVVVNEASGDSIKVAEHYARVRALPPEQLLRINVPVGDTVPRAVYQELIERPISLWLEKHRAQDRIIYIVLTKGVPLRVEGTVGRTGTVGSVDSELTLLYRKMTGIPTPPQGRVANPYYLAASPIAKARRFSHRDHDIYLVTRLDGYTAADVIALIDRGATAAPAGDIVLDQRADLSEGPGEEWLKATAAALTAQGFGSRTVLEETTRAFAGPQPVIGYYSWGSNDPALRRRDLGITFAPGAIAAMFLSSDARTFREPPADWVAGDPRERQRYFGGSSQSLTGDLVRGGVSGVAGYVGEPFADGAVRPDILFPAYVSGFNLAESFYLATPFLSWQSVVVGDPLCSPFALSRRETDDFVQPGFDAATELPQFFSARRLKALVTGSIDEVAAQHFLRADARLARGDKPGAREALEAATARTPGFVAAQLMLASVYEDAGAHDSAIERYRVILRHAPHNGIALNNLAYSLATRRNAAAEAVPLARKAHSLLRGVASADTLGWVLHLSGDSQAAAQLFAQIVAIPALDAEVLFHAATVFEAVGQLDAAARQLDRAITTDATLAARDDVKELRARLSRGRVPRAGAQ